ncbi:MAG: hypothetical protein QXP31_08610, partial [Pyrobaculum sp.]
MRVSKFTILKVGVVAVLAVALAAPVLYSFFVYTPTVNVQCAICHTMSFYVSNVSKPHAQYSCLVCHEISLGDVANMMWTYAVERPGPLEVFYKYYPHKGLYEPCLKCHTDVEKLHIHSSHLSVVNTTDTCSICHAVHIQNFLEESCTKCHAYLPTVEKHMQMHSQEIVAFASTTCSQCHSPESPSYVPPAAVCFQGMVEGKTCQSCHVQLKPPDVSGERCTSCHYK